MIRKLLANVELGYKQSVAYKGDFIIGCFSTLFKMMILAYIWKAVYQNAGTDIIRGRVLTETITYVILAQVIWSFVDTNIEVLLGQKIKHGEVTRDLLKPINFPSLVYLGHFGFSTFILLVQTLPAFILSILIFPIKLPTGIQNIIWTIISIVLAFVIYSCFSFIIGIIGFWTQNMWGLGLFKKLIFSTLSGSLIPLYFYPETVRNWIYILPFKEIIDTPVSIYLGTPQQGIITMLAGQLSWAIIFFALSQLSWVYLKRKVVILGG